MENYDYIGKIILISLVTITIYRVITAKKVYCKACGTEDFPDTKGSFAIELILWLCFLIPGLVYSIWRRSKNSNICRNCHSSEVIPADSPIAKSIKESKK